MNFHSLIVLSLVCLIVACSTAPPKSQRLINRAELEGSSGTLLVVDVCLNEDLLGDDDYFVVNEAREGAQVLMNAVERYLSTMGVNAGAKLIPFVCGALHDSANNPKRVAQSIEGVTTNSTQPFGIADEIARDPEYLSALQKLATYIFQGALVGKGNAVANTTQASTTFVTETEARTAATTVAARTRMTHVIYIGVTGNSLSAGKAAASALSSFVTGVALSVAVGPIPIDSYTSVQPIFVPEAKYDSRQMVAGLLDLRTGTLNQSTVVHGGGDPMKPDTLAQQNALHLLLRKLVFTNVK